MHQAKKQKLLAPASPAKTIVLGSNDLLHEILLFIVPEAPRELACFALVSKVWPSVVRRTLAGRFCMTCCRVSPKQKALPQMLENPRSGRRLDTLDCSAALMRKPYYPCQVKTGLSLSSFFPLKLLFMGLTRRS